MTRRMMYHHPTLYAFLVSFFYPKKLRDRIRNVVGKNVSVFEIAAGYGRVADLLDPSVAYSGIDLNETFVRFGQKRGRDLKVADIFDPSVYKASDIVLVIDILHHFNKDKMRALMGLAFENANKKLIVIEPSFVSWTRRFGAFGRFAGWILKKMDSDGINMIEEWLTRVEYEALFANFFGSKEGQNFTVEHERLGGHHLVVYMRKAQGGF